MTPKQAPARLSAVRTQQRREGCLMLSPDEIAANPIGTELIYEDERIRVWRIELAPGEVAGAPGRVRSVGG